jgi:hypothetical protein
VVPAVGEAADEGASSAVARRSGVRAGGARASAGRRLNGPSTRPTRKPSRVSHKRRDRHTATASEWAALMKGPGMGKREIVLCNGLVVPDAPSFIRSEQALATVLNSRTSCGLRNKLRRQVGADGRIALQRQYSRRLSCRHHPVHFCGRMVHLRIDSQESQKRASERVARAGHGLDGASEGKGRVVAHEHAVIQAIGDDRAVCGRPPIVVGLELAEDNDPISAQLTPDCAASAAQR